MAALGADAQAGGQIFVVNDLPARWTLDPEPLGNTALIRLALDRLTDLLKPSHSSNILHCGLAIADCGFLDCRLPIETADLRLRLPTADLRLTNDD